MENDKKSDPDAREPLSVMFEKARIGIQIASDEARKTLKTGEKIVSDVWDEVQENVGKDRIIGAITGAKIGGTFGVVGGTHGVVLGGAVGTVIGFAGGRKFFDWYNKKGRNDNDPK